MAIAATTEQEGKPANGKGHAGASRGFYLAVLAYLAVLYIRPGETVPGWEGTPFVFAASILAIIFAFISLTLSPRNPFSTPMDKFLVAFYATVILSRVAQGWFGGAYMAVYEFMPMVFAYLMVRLAVSSERQASGMATVLAGLMVFHAINGIVQHYTGVGLGLVTTIQDGRIRATGIFNDPNDLGLSLVMVVPFLLTGTIYPRWGFLSRLVAAGSLACVLLAIFYTDSRGAALGVAAVVVSYSIRHFHRLGPRIAAGILVLGLFTLAPSRVGQMTASEGSAQGRIQAWYAGLQMFKWKPILGVGYDGFTEHHPLAAHNSFVHSFAELGFVGGFLFIGFFYWYFRGLRARGLAPPGDRFERLFVLDMAISAIGVAVCAFFLSRQYSVVLYVLFALGAATADLRQRSEGGAERLQTRPLDLAVIFLISVAALVLFSILVRTLD